jgi:lipoprotein-anchoring transpeptidase ErfK/SrfK
MQRGLRALRAGRRLEARQAFQAALAAEPTNAGAWLHLARLSAPRARLAYLARAIELGDAHARAELRRARRQAQPGLAGPSAVALPQPVGDAVWLYPSAVLVFLAVAAIAVLTSGGGLPRLAQAFASSAGLAPAGASAPLQAAGARLRAMPTATASPTHTLTQTATPEPTASPSPTASSMPTDTATFPPPTDTPAAPAERWIEVDLSDQMVLAREDATAVNTFLVSTGTWQYPTVVGEFRVYVKYPAADMAGPGYYLPAVPYVMYFYEGYGLHGTYWHNNFGTPMSHGCVNLRTEDAGWLFEWASVGTRVVVHD